MFAGLSWIVATTIALFSVCTYAQESASSNQQLVSQVCLGCICEVTSGCNTTIGCYDSVCGPFAITWGYWSDAGKPTLNNEPSSTDGAYPRCVNDPYCAARAIQGYMAKFGQDCTGNGVIDCDDYLRIHRFGGYGCTSSLDKPASSNQQIVSQICLDCICEVATGCNMTVGCSNLARPCGPFFIQWSYWLDAGKPTVNNEPSNTDDAFIRCVNDFYCASRAVEAYMIKFNQDCTGDGVIDCDDYLRIHRLGGNGCTGSLDRKYLNKYKLCIQTNGGQ